MFSPHGGFLDFKLDFLISSQHADTQGWAPKYPQQRPRESYYLGGEEKKEERRGSVAGLTETERPESLMPSDS